MLKYALKICSASALLFLPSTPGLAQQAAISLGAQKHDSSLPVEVTADSLSVDRQTSTAVFKGNALAGQGQLRLSAGTITVTYTKDGKSIDFIEAFSNVMFTNGEEIAEAHKGVYRISQNTITMTGDVILLQGQNAISGDALRLNLETNQGTMEGNVKSIFVPKDEQ